MAGNGRRPLVWAYALHLLVPLAVVIDLVAARYRDAVWGLLETLLAAGGTAFLALGLLVSLVGARRASVWGPWMERYLLAFFAAAVATLVGEGLLRVVLPLPQEGGLWPGGSFRFSAPDAQLMPGVSGESRFTVNTAGLRGPDDPSDEADFVIIAIGGSTTENIVLDDSEAWPHLLGVGLEDAQDRLPVWVANAGQSGRNMAEHRELIEALPAAQNADLLVFMVGVNDMLATLAADGGATTEMVEERAREFRRQIERRPAPTSVARRMAWFRLLSGVRPIRGVEQNPREEFYRDARARRVRGPTVPLPDLSTGLEEYRARIHQVADRCVAYGRRCLFLTQPSIYRDRLTSRERSLLWYGSVGPYADPRGYLTVQDLGRAIRAFNGTLLDACREDRLECFDIADRVARDTTVFYDDVHFNESGARAVAQRLTSYLLERPPFGESGSSGRGGRERNPRARPSGRPSSESGGR
jgi:lysophospholipase L1-like esterase